MPLTFGVLDPSNWSQSDALMQGVGPGGSASSGDTFTINSYTYTTVSVDSDTLVDVSTASDLTSPVTIGGTPYAVGDSVENDYEVIFVDPSTGLYYRINAISIDNDFVGVIISQAWDTTTGAYVAGPPPAGTTLTAIDGDDLDGTPNVDQFATDNNYVDELGNDSEIGAGNGIPVCFGAGTLIATDRGLRPVEALNAGDHVITSDGGPKPILWITKRLFDDQTLAANPKFRPIRIKRGALGAGLPRRDLIVSPQHRLLVRSRIAQRMFGQAEVLVAARLLVDCPGIEVADDLSCVTYVHFVCDGHQLVEAEGALAETLFLGNQAELALGRDALAEIRALLPDGMIPIRAFGSGKRGRQLVARHIANHKPLVA